MINVLLVIVYKHILSVTTSIRDVSLFSGQQDAYSTNFLGLLALVVHSKSLPIHILIVVENYCSCRAVNRNYQEAIRKVTKTQDLCSSVVLSHILLFGYTYNQLRPSNAEKRSFTPATAA